MTIDLKKQLPDYRAAEGRFELVTVPARQYLMIDGQGDPNTSPAYAEAVAALFPLAYALKFFSKRQLCRDYVVMPLQGLWWADDMAAFTTRRDKSTWYWTMLTLLPEWLTAAHVETAREAVAAKGSATRVADVRLDVLDEGLCVQTLHVGSYDDEGPVLRRLHEQFVREHGLSLRGRHHEIYLSDARRTAPERLRTILRQPVQHLA